MRIPAVAALAVALLVPAPRAQAQIIEYYHLDATGNVLAVTNQAGQVVETHDYLPFGEELCGSAPCSGPAAGQPKRFTGKERDVETGLDYFGARYYRANLGRFTTVDPGGDLRANILNAQRWNKYAYGINNPLRFQDPDGREVPVVMDGKVYNGGLDGMSAGDQHAQNVVFGALVGVTGLFAAGFAAPALLPTAVAVATNPRNQEIVGGLAEGFSGAAPGTISGPASIAAQAERAALSDAALVCRGGTCTAGRFAAGSGVTTDAGGRLSGVSVNSANGAAFEQLTTTIPNKQVGVTTVGRIRAAGGNVVPRPTPRNPMHCEMCGITPTQAEGLFTPTVRNPHVQ
jgi:RHS repeat-associated protein